MDGRRKVTGRDVEQAKIERQESNMTSLDDNLGRVTGTKMRGPFTMEELESLLRTAEKTLMGPIIALAAYTGLRRAEIAGLKWSDVDLDAATIAVRRSVIDAGREVIVRDHPSAIRTIPLRQPALEALRQQRRMQAAWRAQAGENWLDDGWVFSTRHGKVCHPASFSRGFTRIRKKTDIRPITFHGLRQTFAAIILGSGVSLDEVSKMLGHGSVSTTQAILGNFGKEASENERKDSAG